MGNKEKIVGVLRRSLLTPLTYSDLRAVAGVPVESFDRTLAALVRNGRVLKDRDGYRPVRDGSAIETEESRSGSRILVYCARCEGAHPSPDKRRGETFEEVHRRARATSL